jgi:D-arabinose 1-dehydrogenase-like Zn-dependent alcohol dehydrogenase
MRAVQLTRIGKALEQADIPIPEIGSSDVLIRVAAAGICHSDAHYRAGMSKIDYLPLTLGHEIAGRVEEAGADVTHVSAGDRVCVHYLVHCGSCEFCMRGLEQFCRSGQMIGKHRDGGYAEFIKVPGVNAFPLPGEIPFEVGAIMMCSSATALHALNKARLKPGESVAIFGFGGLGFSALQLARAFDCGDVYVIEINPAKLASAKKLGAKAIDANAGDPVEQIKDATAGRGVDVALELIGSGSTMTQAVRCLGRLGRAALVGLTAESMSIFPYPELINKEAEIIGVSDHLATELPGLIEFARSAKLRFPPESLRFVDLDSGQINAALDSLQDSIDHVRTVMKVASDPPSSRFGVTRGYGVASELMNSQNLSEFAKRYAQAWCSQNPENVAAFFAEKGSLSVNNEPPAVGRAAIAEVAREFMRDFPDLVVRFDKLEPQPDAIAFHWTLIGTNTGPGGKGNRVWISGYELWRIDKDGLIAESKGHFNTEDYQRQLRG